MSTSDDNRLRSLASMARALARSTTLESTLEIATAEVLSALGPASASISRLEPGSWILRTLINDGILGPTEARWPTDEVYRLEDFPAFVRVYHNRDIWVTSLDKHDTTAIDIQLLKSFGKGSALTAPLVVDDTIWGELYMCWHSASGAQAAADAAHLDAITAILESGISRTLHAESLKRLAFRDPLTGLANRRGLDLAVAQAFAEVDGGSGRRISVVTVDVNDLKIINDTAGHDEGDRLIAAVARQIEESFAALFGSLPARVGGDEFSILVPGHPVAMVVAAADEVSIRIRILGLGAGVACGVASQLVTDPDSVPRLLFSAADAAMYQAKRAGSASAVLADEVSAAQAPPRPCDRQR